MLKLSCKTKYKLWELKLNFELEDLELTFEVAQNIYLKWKKLVSDI